MALARQRIEQPPAAAVAVVRHHECVARLQQRVQHQRDRGHAGRRDHAAGAAFEFGERIAEQVARRIAAARVVVTALVVEAGEAEIGSTGPAAASPRRRRCRNRCRRAPRAWRAGASGAHAHRRYAAAALRAAARDRVGFLQEGVVAVSANAGRADAPCRPVATRARARRRRGTSRSSSTATTVSGTRIVRGVDVVQVDRFGQAQEPVGERPRKPLSAVIQVILGRAAHAALRDCRQRIETCSEFLRRSIAEHRQLARERQARGAVALQ